MGDWMIENGLDRSKPHHSADILHQLLHTDVGSLGRAASGSAEALVLRVTEVFGETYCYLFPPIEEPKEILIYFSESNDIDDNNILLDNHRIPYIGMPARRSYHTISICRPPMFRRTARKH